MDSPKAQQKLIALLQEVGIKLLEHPGMDDQTGFPLTIGLPNGSSLTLDLPYPAQLSSLDPEQIGVAIIDAIGQVRKTWGLGRRVALFRSGKRMIDTPLANPFEEALAGMSSTVYLDGVRFHFAPLIGNAESSAAYGAFVLLVNAAEERKALHLASKNERFARVLKHLGKILTMNHSPNQISTSAAHQITSLSSLAATLLWRTDETDGMLKLVASVGVNRAGNLVIQELNPNDGTSCVAELAAASRKSFFQSNVLENVMTANLEAKICYLAPGGVSVHPLCAADRLLGVIELIGTAGDVLFEEDRELFETFAEHLALAIHAAEMYELAEQRSKRDPLTSLANHRCMQDFLLQRVSESERTKQTIGVVMLDVDHFRAFNEEEGHDAGDQVLRLVGDILKSLMRSYDLAARYGGEEFTVILPGCSLDTVLTISERIRGQIEATPFVTASGRQRHLTVSIGCATYPENAIQPGDLLKAADLALFEAKRNGRNRVEYYRGRMEGQADEKPITIDTSPWIAPELVAETEKFLLSSAEDVDRLSEKLPLSRAQKSILLALASLWLTFAQASDAFKLEMSRSNDLRAVWPSLVAIEERFDGTGPKELAGARIPLLTRALQVLIALHHGNGAELILDPTRFDPEMVAILGDLRRAA